MKQALHYEKKSDGHVQCLLCPHSCTIADGKRGRCGVRENQSGILYSMNYGKITGLSIDPVSKKPLRHFMPGTMTLSVGSFGCNLFCPFCQNHHIARATSGGQTMHVNQFVDLAIAHSSPSIALTYNEPFMFYEWALNAAKAAKEHDLAVILVTNGYVCSDPLAELLPFVDAMNIDLKSFDPALHKQFTGGDLTPILETIETVASSPCHLELTTLMVPGLSDDLTTLEHEFAWIASIDADIPLHLSRYFPCYHYHEEATHSELILQAKHIAQQYLTTVYTGNL